MTKASSSFNIKKIDRVDGGLMVDVMILPDHKIFEGHFPDNPVMPGVLNIEILQEVLQNKYPTYKIAEVSTVKFLKPIRPFENLLLQYDIKVKEGDDDIVKVNAEGSIDAGIFVKVQLKLAKH